MSISSLEPTIHNILSAPETDLATISAKRVRKLIPELRADITAEFVKANKEEINDLIGKIYETLNRTNDGGINNSNSRHETPGSTTSKRKREDTDEENVAEDSDSKSFTTDNKIKHSSKLTDEAYAKKLSSELNQRPSRTNRTHVKTKKVSTKGPKSKKSRSEVVDSDGDDDGNDDDDDSTSKKGKASKPRKKSSGSGEAKGGFAKEFALSEPLTAVVGTARLSRPQVVKKLWEYIKSRDLQNPNNKKEILCDDSLRILFSTDKINMFTMNKVLSNHLYPLD